MSIPVEQMPPPPPAAAGGGSIGAVIGVLVVIAVLGIIAGIVGRLCSGRRIFGYGHFDCEGWIERRCAVCIDGRIEAAAVQPQARPNAAVAATSPENPPEASCS